MRRTATIDDVGKSALYLLSDLSSGVTGENLHVDSGYHVVGMKAVDAPDIDVVTEEGLMTERLPHEKFHVSWDQLRRTPCAASVWMADPDENGAWRAVVAITRGGVAPAMIIAREVDIRLVDTISVKSYNHQTQSDRASSKCLTKNWSAMVRVF